MKVLFQVNKAGSTSAWSCNASKDEPGFNISKRVASVLPSNVLRIKGNTAILYGTPELNEVFNQETRLSAGFRLVGVNGSIVDELYLLDAKMEAQVATNKAVKEMTEIN